MEQDRWILDKTFKVNNDASSLMMKMCWFFSFNPVNRVIFGQMNVKDCCCNPVRPVTIVWMLNQTQIITVHIPFHQSAQNWPVVSLKACEEAGGV